MMDRRRLFNKLPEIAEVIHRERGPLVFCGLLHREGKIDRWQFIVSAGGLDGFTAESLRYLADLLRKRLTRAEMVSLSGMVPLKKNDPLIKALRSDEGIEPGRLSVPMDDRFDRAYVVTPMAKKKKKVFQPA